MRGSCQTCRKSAWLVSLDFNRLNVEVWLVNVFLFAQDTGALDWGQLATQVPLVVLAMVVGWVLYKQWFVPGPNHLREVERADKAWDENLRLRDALENKVLPALIRSTDLTEEAVRVLDSTVDMLGRTNDALGVLHEVHEETKRLHEDARAIHERVLSALKEWE